MNLKKVKILGGKHSRIALLLVLVVIVFSLVGFVRLYAEWDDKTDVDYELESLNLRVGLSRLRTLLSGLEKKYVSGLGTSGYVSITLLSLSEDFVKEAERMGDGRVPYVLAMSENNIPGDNGCIGIDYYESLLAKGWDSCLYFKGADGITPEELSVYLESLKPRFDEIGIDMPTVLIIGKGYSKELDSVALMSGISIVCARDSGVYPLIEATRGEGGVWHPGVLGWNTLGKSKNTLSSLEKHGGHFIFTLDRYDGSQNSDTVESERFLITEDGNARYDYEESFSAMLNYMVSIESKGGIKITTIKDALSARITYLNLYDEMLPVMEAERAGIVAQMAVLEEELYALIKEYGE